MVLTVGVVCINGDQEDIFMDVLQRSNKISPTNIVFDYSNIENPSSILVYMLLKKFKERQLPILVLISKEFLERVIPTDYKRPILKEILKWESNIVHVWLGELKEKVVRSYSSALCRTNGHFTRVSECDLPVSITKWAGVIANLFIDTIPKFSQGNYNISSDNYYDEKIEYNGNLPSMSTDDSMDTINSTLVSGLVKNENNAPVITQKKTKKKKPKKEDVYSQAANNVFRLMKETVPDTSLEDVGSADTASNKKKKKPKKRTTSSPFKDLTYGQLTKISNLLDVGYGANWKQIAGIFQIDRTTIEHIELALKRNESPSMNLFTLLGTQKPDLTLGQIVDACKYIVREDVVQVIEKDILKSTVY